MIDPTRQTAAGTAIGAAGAALAMLGVAAGAFGAHALRGRLDPAMLQVFETAVRYQLVHALAMIIVWLALERRGTRGFVIAGWLFAAGIVLFSGSLFALSLTGVRAWGMVTPFGGLCFLLGWPCLAWAVLRRDSAGGR